MDRVPSLETTERLLAHTEWLTRVARALTTSAEDAEEVVQQTWLKALERPPEHGGNLRGWLATLARNLVRSRRRSSVREAVRVRSLPRPEPARGPEESVARAELQQMLLDAVLALAEPYRSTLVLRFLDDLSADEIAKKGGEPLETVRTRVKRGLEQVRARVAQKLEADREQLPALLAPLLAAGALAVTSTAKVGLLIGAAAAVLATILVLTHARTEGGARGDGSSARSLAPAVAAASSETTAPPAVATRDAELATPEGNLPATIEPTADSAKFDVTGIVLDLHGAPVAGASVMLFDRKSGYGSDDIGLMAALHHDMFATTIAAGLAYEITSDDNGEFRFKDVDGFRRWRVAATDLTEGTSELKEAALADGVTPAPIELELRGGIGVRGRVVDEAGKPTASAQVMLSYRTSEASMTMTCPPDRDGRFNIPPMPVEQLELTAEVWGPGTRRSSPTLVVRAADGLGVREVTLQLPAAPPPSWLRGRLVDHDGEPLARHAPLLERFTDWELTHSGFDTLAVALLSVAPPAPGATPPGARWTASIDVEHASYAFRLPIDGTSPTNSIAVVARGHVLAAASLSSDLLTPGEEDRTGPDLIVDETRLSSTPASACLRLVTRDANLQRPFTHPQMFVEIHSTMANGDGHNFSVGSADPATLVTTIAPVKPGHVVLVAKCPGFVPGWAELDAAARAEPYDVEIALDRAERRIRGTVVDADHRPVADARVWWIEAQGTGFRRSAVDPATSAADGRFELNEVGSAAGRIAVQSTEFAPSVVDVAAGSERTTVDVVLQRGNSVVFRWAIPSDRNPPSANLRIVDADGRVVWQDWGGAYYEWRNEWPRRLTLAPGAYHYLFAIMGLADAEGDFVARDGTEIVIAPRSR
jgi:RNA polymerase sigma-70 factor (ECF subfamily)